ncbi:MAG: hypothetical protein AB3N14_05425 [Flavobacteriaceae bacterium]
MKTKSAQNPFLMANSTLQKEAKKKEIKKFALIMFVFTFGMAALLFYEVSSWYIWYGYLAIWTILEYRIVKNLNLKWWYWILIIALILGIDLAVVELVAYLK